MANTPNLDLENVNVLIDTEYAYNQLVSEIIAKINNNNLKIDELPNDFILSTEKGVVNGVASLGNDGIIPKTQLPTDSGSVERVADITARDAIVNLYDNKLVFVIDASADLTVTSGWAMYIYNLSGITWTKIVDGESLDIDLTWNDIQNKPEVFPPDYHVHSQININAQNISDLQSNKVDTLEGSRLVSETEIEVFNDKYSKTEVDDKISDVTFPLATTLVDGLMSKENVIQVDSNKTDILSAKTTLGDVAMTTSAQTVKGAINELDADIGNKSTLITTNKTNLVNAVNETKEQINSLDAEFDAHKANNTAHEVIPKGLISMWSGLISAIPNGWVLCNGQNGTPNLTDRFIMGATADATINKTGGQNTVTLAVNQIPSHNHNGSTNSTGAHNHEIELSSSIANDHARVSRGNTNISGTCSTGDAGNHAHTLNIDSTGGGQAHENRPAYYTLAFIMKV